MSTLHQRLPFVFLQVTIFPSHLATGLCICAGNEAQGCALIHSPQLVRSFEAYDIGEDYLQKGNGANEEERNGRYDEANGHDWQSAYVVSQ